MSSEESLDSERQELSASAVNDSAMVTDADFHESVAPLHRRLDVAEFEDIYVVGDVHGCLAELEALWRELGPGADDLVVSSAKGPTAEASSSSSATSPTPTASGGTTRRNSSTTASTCRRSTRSPTTSRACPSPSPGPTT